MPMLYVSQWNIFGNSSKQMGETYKDKESKQILVEIEISTIDVAHRKPSSQPAGYWLREASVL